MRIIGFDFLFGEFGTSAAQIGATTVPGSCLNASLF
jgi:hypothetical protein